MRDCHDCHICLINLSLIVENAKHPLRCTYMYIYLIYTFFRKHTLMDHDK